MIFTTTEVNFLCATFGSEGNQNILEEALGTTSPKDIKLYHCKKGGAEDYGQMEMSSNLDPPPFSTPRFGGESRAVS